MKRKFRTFEEVTVEYYKHNPEQIPSYLKIAFEESERDGNRAAFLLALKIAVEASSGMAEFAKKLGKSRTSLYKTLSEKGNPLFETIDAILQQLGCRLTIQPMS